MGDKRNYAALDWVIGEIREALKDARQALEAYVEDPRDATRIRFCLTYIHQVLGSLKMIEFQGASLFAEEMERLAQAIMNDNVAAMGEAQEVLMRSLLQLPLYLDHVSQHRDDHPGIVLPLLNDLRAARKKHYLSETNLFSPDLSALKTKVGSKHPVLSDRAKLKQALNKLRQMYQFAAASLLRGIKIDENLAYIKKVFLRLEGITKGTHSFALWHASVALVDCLIEDEIELSVAVKGLFRHLARELKVLEENCPSALDAPVRENLIRNILYYVARADSSGKHVVAVKKRYVLDEALFEGAVSGRQFDRNMISAPEPDAIRSVVVALQDEINTVKHVLGLAISGQGTVSDVEEILPVIKRVADTLAVLGIADMRRQALEQGETLKAMCVAGDFDDDDIAIVASNIVQIEHRLDAIKKNANKSRSFSNVDERKVEIDEAKATVLAECRTGLEKFKEAIVEFYSSNWDLGCLDSVPEQITTVRGGLKMIPLDRPAAIIDTCGKYVQEQFIDCEGQPDGGGLVKLAYAVEGVDYYLEQFAAEQTTDIDKFLELAEESLLELSYPVPGAPGTGVEQVEQAGAETSIVTEQTPEPSQETEPAQNEYAANDERVDAAHVSTDLSEPSADLSEPSTNLSEPETSLDSLETSADVTITETDSPAAPETPVATEKPVAEVDEQVDEQVEEEEDPIDEEIVEIFIEEAGEVLEALDENMPKWEADLCDEEPLTIVRRSFHTLKGSGRMVRAMDIGELAWSVENMLNRVIDESVPASPVHAEFIQKVMALVPILVTAFENKQQNPEKELTEKYMAWGESFSEGRIPPEFVGGDIEISSEENVQEPEFDITAEFTQTEAPELLVDDAVNGDVSAEEPHAGGLSAEESEFEEVDVTVDFDDVHSLAGIGDELPLVGASEGGDMASSPTKQGHSEAESCDTEADELTAAPTENEHTESADLASDTPVSAEGDTASDLTPVEDDEDRVLLELFASEAQTHLGVVNAFIREMEAAAPIYRRQHMLFDQT